MKKAVLLSVFILLISLNYTARPSYAENENAVITLVKAGKSIKIKTGELGKHCKCAIAEKLVKIILSGKEELIGQSGLNPEKDVTDNESMLSEGKTLSNQTAYLRKAGIDTEKTTLGRSPDGTINETLKNSAMVYYTSLVDIDSDGVDEIRFHSLQGSLMEEDNYFFKKDPVSGAFRLLDKCSLGGGTDKAIFLKYLDKVYAAERNPENLLSGLKLYSFDAKNEEFEPLFTIEIERSGTKVKNLSLILDEK